ncbi:DUF3800 domain-containing protein [Bordetella bronchialis]|uniref:DUF3800 domain-containing protein n=1 Tax=Bordetella bronchialis TaxID=463025 RepID=UPI003D0423AA
MYIFVDESGTFAFTDKENAWCTVAGYVLPESGRRRLDSLLSDLRLKHGAGREVKLGTLPESAFIKFLIDLEKLGGIAFAVAVDISLHRREQIQRHQLMQVEKIRQNIDKMLYEEGRRAIAEFAEEIIGLPPQLYTQLVLQVELVHTVLKLAPLYFVQREPVSLANFRWRIDQKDRLPNRYEKVFRKILPGLLQTKSLQDPMIFLEGEDYRYFKRFEYKPGTAPTYLNELYGLDVDTSDGNSVNVGLMINDDFSYVDSKQYSGVQVADLIASGVRRALRSQFDSPTTVASALGLNLLQAARGETVIRLLSLDQTGIADEKASAVVRLMGKYARPMLQK